MSPCTSRMTALRARSSSPWRKARARSEVWRALYGAAFFKADCGKICIAVNEDIDPTIPMRSSGHWRFA